MCNKADPRPWPSAGPPLGATAQHAPRDSSAIHQPRSPSLAAQSPHRNRHATVDAAYASSTPITVQINAGFTF